MRTKTGVLTFTDLSQMQKMRRGSELGSFLDEMNVIRPEELIGELTAHFQEGSGNLSRFFMDYRYRDFASVARVRRMMPVYGAKGITPGITRQANFVELLLGKESDLAGTGFNENIFGISYLNGEDTVTMSDRELEMEIGKVGIIKPLLVSPGNADKLARTLCRLWEAQEKDPSTRFVILTGRAGERSVEIIRQLYMLIPDRLRLQLGFQTNVTTADLDRIQTAKLPIYILTAEPGQNLTARKWAFPVVECEWERVEQYPCDENRLALVRKLAGAMNEKLAAVFGKAERAVLYQKESDVSSFKYYGDIVKRLFSGDTAAPERKPAEKAAAGSGQAAGRRSAAAGKAAAAGERSADYDAQPWRRDIAPARPVRPDKAIRERAVDYDAKPWLKDIAPTGRTEKSPAADDQPWRMGLADGKPAAAKAEADAQPWLKEQAGEKPAAAKTASDAQPWLKGQAGEKPATADAQPWLKGQAGEKAATAKPAETDAQPWRKEQEKQVQDQKTVVAEEKTEAAAKSAERVETPAAKKVMPEFMPWIKAHLSGKGEAKANPDSEAKQQAETTPAAVTKDAQDAKTGTGTKATSGNTSVSGAKTGLEVKKTAGTSSVVGAGIATAQAVKTVAGTAGTQGNKTSNVTASVPEAGRTSNTSGTQGNKATIGITPASGAKTAADDAVKSGDKGAARTQAVPDSRLTVGGKPLENMGAGQGESGLTAEQEVRELTHKNRKLVRENSELTRVNIALGEKVRKLEKELNRFRALAGGGADDASKKAGAGEGSGSPLSSDSGDGDGRRTKRTYEQLERRNRQLYKKIKTLRKRVMIYGTVSIFLFMLLVVVLISYAIGMSKRRSQAEDAGQTAVETQTGAESAENGDSTGTPGTEISAESEEVQTGTEEGGEGPDSTAEGTSPAETSQAVAMTDEWTAIQGSDPGTSITWAETTDRLGQPAGYIVHFHVRFAEDTNGTGLSEDSSLPYLGAYVNSKPADTDEARYYQWTEMSSIDPANGLKVDWIDVPGIDYYFHIAYAADENGTDFSTTDSTGRACVGYYISGHADGGVSPDSGNYSDYTWVYR